MSNYVASESNERHKSYKTGMNRRAEDEGNEDEEKILDLPFGREFADFDDCYQAFAYCSELKSMTIPDSLQSVGNNAFHQCSKLVPSNIDVDYDTDEEEEEEYYQSDEDEDQLGRIDTTPEVVAYLRAQQNQF
ncbi:hypothetical protein TrLO_g12294 [Triparma laevis f. longispina]|uniref:Uncharacterized protein n=1 Tax=Triparma laevis f. longispina TaxID=1714387 RepID=A0A9W7FPC4_9STRA|nr:hypothetical protein TrLO_g12294 [Triparma laevis f. longispina]